MWKFCWNGEFSKYVLPRTTKIIKAYIWFNKERQTIRMIKEQQVAFEEIKCRLIRPPVSHLPNSTGRFHLYSDTSKFATGSTLYKMKNGQPEYVNSSTQLVVKEYKSHGLEYFLGPCKLISWYFQKGAN